MENRALNLLNPEQEIKIRFFDKIEFHWLGKKLYCRKFDFFINVGNKQALFCAT